MRYSNPIRLLSCTTVLTCCLLSITALGPSRGLAQTSDRDTNTLACILSQRLGSDLGDESEVVFSRIAVISVAADGRLFVLDPRERGVFSFSPEGIFLSRFGREGGGPGEFQRPLALHVSGETVSVMDSGTHRLAVFSLDGNLLSDARIPEEASRLRLRAYWPLRGGRSIAETSMSVDASTGVPDEGLNTALIIGGAGTSDLDTLAVLHSGLLVAERSGEFPAVPVPMKLGRGAAWGLSGDSLIVVVDGMEGSARIIRVDKDAIAFSEVFDMGWEPLPFPDEKLHEAREVVRAMRSVRSTSRVGRIDFRPTPGIGRASRIVFGPDQTIWIGAFEITPAGEDGEVWTVLELDGTILHKGIRFHPGFSLAAIHGDRFWGRSISDWGSPVVDGLDCTWSTGGAGHS